ncbi:unnamed protein product [Heligmosomoides polygyrus]|uniref:Acyl_transf_3 domain-containing protein n=1 Tax=Heligmosomoides polygyrus TaxID=6339 RepID=A0A183FNF6_HELPZ|nr:unnamed protein product [Heligmosomoides polygyrus]
MKKEVIQGIRGWGVFLLLLFHHYTKTFPNGYIGADMAKQMLPLYYFATFLILLTAYILLPISYQQTNLERSKTAMLLISNIKLSCIENNLSIMLPSIEDAFGHMWLPCLLVQWYLVAPYLFWIQRRVTENDKTFFAVLAACSMGLFLFSKKIVSAYWLHCRLWQFCAGALAALYLPKEHESGADGDTGTSSETYIVLGDNGGNRSEKQETVEYGIAVSIGIAYVTSTQLSKVYSRMSSTVVKVVYLLMIVISVGLSMKAVEFQGDELHYTTISLIDAFYDIMNSIY